MVNQQFLRGKILWSILCCEFLICHRLPYAFIGIGNLVNLLDNWLQGNRSFRRHEVALGKILLSCGIAIAGKILTQIWHKILDFKNNFVPVWGDQMRFLELRPMK